MARCATSSRTTTLVKDLAGLVRGSRDDVADKVREQLERTRQMEREIRTLKDRLASGKGLDLAAGAVDVNGVKVVATKVDGADAGALRAAVDQLKERLKSAVIVLASVESPTQGGAGRRRDRRADRSASRRANWSGPWRHRSADAAADGRILRRPAAPSPRRWMPRWPRSRNSCARG